MMSAIPVEYDHVIEELLLALVDKLHNKEFDLPPLPQVASQVLACSTNPDTEVKTLTALIQQDPILTAKIFQIGNSAACGAHRKIDSLGQAIMWLGLNTVATTAFMQSVQAGVFDTHGYEAEVKILWRHAWATGYYAKTIAGVTATNADTAFLFGLLHSIGKPFVVHTVNQFQKHSQFPLPWTAILTIINQSSREVGRQLAEAWAFPDPVKEAINLHEDHAFHLGTSPTKAAAITNLAHHLATYWVDPQDLSENTLRSLPSLQFLHLPDDVIDVFLSMHDMIHRQVNAMLT